MNDSDLPPFAREHNRQQVPEPEIPLELPQDEIPPPERRESGDHALEPFLRRS
jgi:hypothetical protein